MVLRLPVALAAVGLWLAAPTTWAAPARAPAPPAASAAPASAASRSDGGATAVPDNAPQRGPRHFEDLTGDLPGDPITAAAVDPDDDQVLYAGTDGFLWKSDDGGESWRPVLSFPRGVANDDEDGAGGDVGGVEEQLPLEPLSAAGEAAPGASTGAANNGQDDLPEGSADEVDTTVFTRAGPGVRAIAFVPGSPGVFYVATPRGLFRTATRGGSFERIGKEFGALENDVRDVVVDPARPSRIYVATARGVLVSKDGGASFSDVHGSAGTTPALCAAVGPDGAVILVGTEQGLFRSFDGGDSFLEVLLRGLPPFFGVASVAISPKSGTYYAGTAEGLFVGERGAALLERYDGVPPTLVQALSPDRDLPRGVAVGTRTRGVLFSWDAGVLADENAEQVPASEVLAVARGKKPYDVLVATDRGLFRSVPGTGVTISSSALKKLRADWEKEPSLEDTARDALAWSRIDPGDIASMESRAGWAHVMPQLSARFEYTNVTGEAQDQFLLRAGDELPPGVDPNNDNTDLFGNTGAFLITPSTQTTYVIFATLQWDLDKLILNEDQVAVGRRIPQWWGAEKRVLDRVREAFTARRRLMAEMALADLSHGDKAVKAEAARELRFEELTAELDAATGGAFSRNHKLEERK